MIDYSSLYRRLAGTPLASGAEALRQRVEAVWRETNHGDLRQWMDAIERLPKLPLASPRIDRPCVGVDDDRAVSPEQLGSLRTALQGLHPWRKGPFCLYGVHVDAEWRSDLKWARVEPVIAPLRGRLVLDVGCGNGYYGWRMLGAGAALVLGVDPSLRFVCQYQALRTYLGDLPNYVVPLGLDAVPDGLSGFDTVFSMGVFYHRRSPFDHLFRLRELLRSGGELVLETLVIEGDEGRVLVPADRYAQMRNVWFLPSTPTLEGWLRRCGFRQVRTVDVTPTTEQEQRRTEWMRFHSLRDFLEANDPKRTVEGHPAPLRAIVVAQAP